MNKIAKKTIGMALSKKIDGNTIITTVDFDGIYLPFRKFEVDFKDESSYNVFITSVEKLVRCSKIYSAYLAYLINDVGIDWCSYFGNVKIDDAKIEFHHGPIFNLYDYCNIMARKMLSETKTGITTFDVADEVLRLHKKNLVSLVSLSESVHKAAHNRKYTGKELMIGPHFVDIRSSFGNFRKFITEFNESLTSYEISKIFAYYRDYERHLSEGDKDKYFEPIIQIFTHK